MPRKYKRNPNSRIYKKYDPQTMTKAIEAIEINKMSIRKAAAMFNINFSVLQRRLKNKNTIKSQGGQTVLNENEEAFITNRIQICAEWGYPIDSFTLRMLVKNYLDASGKIIKKFKNNCPGKDFAYSFLSRHKKELSERLCQNIKRNRAAVSRETVTEYFNRLEIELKDVPPGNIVNYDETNLSDDPGRKKVIVKRGCKYPQRIMNSSKSSTSIMFSAAADGTMLPCYVVYKAVNIYDSWTAGGPKFTRYNRTKSGWFDSACFEDWVKTVAVPYFKGKPGKKILIGDNLSTHLSMDSIRMCLEHDIHFIFLPANSTHLTQPLDVAFFAPLKEHWRQILENWKLGAGRNMSSIPKDTFPRLLKRLIGRIEKNASTNVISGFRKCGIFPINKEEVLNMIPVELNECQSDNQADREKQLIDNTFIDLLKSMRYEDAAVAKPKKKKLFVPPGKSVGLEDFSSSDSEGDICQQDEEMESAESENGDCEMDVDDKEETEIYPFQVEQKKIKAGDWLAINFYFSTSKKVNAHTKNNKRTFVGIVTKILSDESFEGNFLRTSASKDSRGFIYRYPVVKDITNFNYDQVVGRLRDPEKYKRGLLKFDYKC